jgi:hypothetical protein
MKVRIQVNVSGLQVDEVVEGAAPDDIVKQLRKKVEARANFVQRLALRAMPDTALWARVVEMHNKQAGTHEPAPATAEEFLAFGERAGYLTRLA